MNSSSLSRSFGSPKPFALILSCVGLVAALPGKGTSFLLNCSMKLRKKASFLAAAGKPRNPRLAPSADTESKPSMLFDGLRSIQDALGFGRCPIQRLLKVPAQRREKVFLSLSESLQVPEALRLDLRYRLRGI